MVKRTSTIAALATAPAPAGIAVVRMSGSESSRILENCFRAKIDPTTSPRHLLLGNLYDHETNETLDTFLGVFMPGPQSFTGEDIVEIQLHGSPILAQKVLRLLYKLGAVPALPGEFTERAFFNGKLDLPQATSHFKLIDAQQVVDNVVVVTRVQGNLSVSAAVG